MYYIIWAVRDNYVNHSSGKSHESATVYISGGDSSYSSAPEILLAHVTSIPVKLSFSDHWYYLFLAVAMHDALSEFKITIMYSYYFTSYTYNSRAQSSVFCVGTIILLRLVSHWSIHYSELCTANPEVYLKKWGSWFSCNHDYITVHNSEINSVATCFSCTCKQCKKV